MPPLRRDRPDYARAAASGGSGASKMMPLPRPRSTRQAQARWEYASGTVARANPIVAAWRWRYELAGAAGLSAAWLALGNANAAWLTAGLVAPLLTCAQAWIHSRYGKLPFIWMTRSRPFGERVYLWCRAGISAVDFSSARELLTAACWATDIQVSHHVRYAHLVALDIIRRESPAEWSGQSWYDTGIPDGSLTIPAPRESAEDSYWLGEPPHEEQPRWLRD